MRYFCLCIQDALKHLPWLPSLFPSQRLCWQSRSVSHLCGSRAPISCLDLPQGISGWVSPKLQTKVRLVVEAESRNPNLSILTTGGLLDATCFIPQPSLPSLCIFQLPLKSAFKLIHGFWPFLYQVAKLHQRSLAPACPRGYMGRASSTDFGLWRSKGNGWERKQKGCRYKRENREKSSVLRTGRGIRRQGKDGACGGAVERRGPKGCWCGERNRQSRVRIKWKKSDAEELKQSHRHKGQER